MATVWRYSKPLNCVTRMKVFLCRVLFAQGKTVVFCGVDYIDFAELHHDSTQLDGVLCYWIHVRPCGCLGVQISTPLIRYAWKEVLLRAVIVVTQPIALFMSLLIMFVLSSREPAAMMTPIVGSIFGSPAARNLSWICCFEVLSTPSHGA